jgi:hypothetical protein
MAAHSSDVRFTPKSGHRSSVDKINTSFAALSWRGRTAEAEADDVKHDYFALI